MKRIVTGVLICTLLLSACGQKSVGAWQEQYDLGVRYLEEGNYEEAIIAFTAAIEIDPKQAPAYVGRGDAYIGSGETEETLAAAQADYETAIELDETNAQAYLGLADVYIRQGEFDKAREVLEIGFEKTGDQGISAKLEEFDGGSITDSSGLSRRMSFYDADGNLQSYAAYTYTNGLQGITDYLNGLQGITTYDPDGNQIAHGEIVRDEHGNIVEHYSVNGSTGELSRITEEYDENGDAIVYEDFEPDGTKIQRREFIYNDQHQVIKEYYWHGDRDWPVIWAYTYDAAGNRIEEITCDMNGDPLYVSTRYSYDSNGNKIEELAYTGPDKDWQSRSVYEYDDFGNIISRTSWDSDGTIYDSDEYFYEYDDNGNIIGGTIAEYRNGELIGSYNLH